MKDVTIVGAGFAGCALAHGLSKQGIAVRLIDRRREYPDLFRAEKIEPEQAELMRKLAIFEMRVPRAEKIGEIINFDGATRTLFDTVDQYGMAYGDTVNSMREQLPDSVEVIYGAVTEVAPDPVRPAVTMADGSVHDARVVVVATAGSPKLLGCLGIEANEEGSLKSLSFGFDIEPDDGNEFSFNGFNYYLPVNPYGIDYLTVFPIGERMRVNLFTQLEPKQDLVRTFRQDPMASLKCFFPALHREIGAFKIVSSVQVVPTSFYILNVAARSGVVIIGDEYQSVNPATGRGLSKVLTDVTVLVDSYIPRWLQQERVAERDVASFYRDITKRVSDAGARGAWEYYRDLGRPTPSWVERVRGKLAV